MSVHWVPDDWSILGQRSQKGGRKWGRHIDCCLTEAVAACQTSTPAKKRFHPKPIFIIQKIKLKMTTLNYWVIGLTECFVHIFFSQIIPSCSDYFTPLLINNYNGNHLLLFAKDTSHKFDFVGNKFLTYRLFYSAVTIARTDVSDSFPRIQWRRIIYLAD